MLTNLQKSLSLNNNIVNRLLIFIMHNISLISFLPGRNGCPVLNEIHNKLTQLQLNQLIAHLLSLQICRRGAHLDFCICSNTVNLWIPFFSCQDYRPLFWKRVRPQSPSVKICVCLCCQYTADSCETKENKSVMVWRRWIHQRQEAFSRLTHGY